MTVLVCGAMRRTDLRSETVLPPGGSSAQCVAALSPPPAVDRPLLPLASLVSPTASSFCFTTFVHLFFSVFYDKKNNRNFVLEQKWKLKAELMSLLISWFWILFPPKDKKIQTVYPMIISTSEELMQSDGCISTYWWSELKIRVMVRRSTTLFHTDCCFWSFVRKSSAYVSETETLIRIKTRLIWRCNRNKRCSVFANSQCFFRQLISESFYNYNRKGC